MGNKKDTAPIGTDKKNKKQKGQQDSEFNDRCSATIFPLSTNHVTPIPGQDEKKEIANLFQRIAQERYAVNEGFLSQREITQLADEQRG
jgi:hypothetical protein